MKIFIVIMHILLGLLLVFYGVNELLQIFIEILGPDEYYRYGISPAQGLFIAIVVSLFGSISFFGAFAFRKDKHWAVLTLPSLVLALSLWIVYSVYSAPKNEAAWTGGIMMLGAFVLFIFFILEILYIKLRRIA